MKPNYITFFTLILLIIIGTSCRPSLNVPNDSVNNRKLNSLTSLEIGQNTIVLTDFVLDVETIDSITVSSPGVKLSTINEKQELVVEVSAEADHFIDIQLWIDHVPYSLPCRKSDVGPRIFTFDPKGKTYKTVRIAGQMNDWTPSATPALQLNENNLYEVTLYLGPGTYLYQLELDGEQTHDPNNPHKVDNGFGKYNSIFEVLGVNDSLPVLVTKNHKKNKVSLHLMNGVENVHVYWQNHRLPERFLKTQHNSLTIDVPAEATQMERSFIRVWATNAFGVSNDVLIPLHNGDILNHHEQIKREDHHAKIIYFLLVDRFKNGNTANDAPLNRPDVHPKVDFWGGDIAGITQKVDNNYFKRLGVNTLWISPVNQNPEGAYGWYAPAQTRFSGYHGYWPVSSSKVDHRFGTHGELKNLVSNAHQKEINVLLDLVANHVHEKHPLIQRNPQFATPLYLPDGTLNVEKWDEHRLTTWFDTFLPTLDYSQPELIELMTDSALYWLTEFNFDGFRHDACKHIHETFWRTLTLKIRRTFPDKHPFQIGETYGSPKLISSYLTTGMLDGQFDFNVYDAANTAFAGVAGDLTRVWSVLQSSLQTYGSHNLMGNISGNHDKARFMAYASGDLKFGENAKDAGWSREIGITDSIAYDKFFLLHTFNFTIPGVPVIYAGDEIGITGGGDPDSRRMMRFEGWNNREQKLWNRVSQLANMRRANPVLMYGSFINLQNTPTTWVYARKYFGQEAIILINNSAENQTIEVALPSVFQQKKFHNAFGENVKVVQGVVHATLPPYSAEVLL